MKTYYQSSEGQMIVDRTFALFPFFLGLFVKAFVYSPLLLTGYLVCRQVLPPGAKGYYWVGLIVGIAAVLYSVLFFVKGVIIAWRFRGNKAWILLLGLCILYTSVPPALVARHLLAGHLPYPWLSWALSAGAGYWAYTRYHFLVDLVPQRMVAFYRAGLQAGGYSPAKKA